MTPAEVAIRLQGRCANRGSKGWCGACWVCTLHGDIVGQPHDPARPLSLWHSDTSPQGDRVRLALLTTIPGDGLVIEWSDAHPAGKANGANWAIHAWDENDAWL